MRTSVLSRLPLLFLALLFWQCQQSTRVDLIVHNGLVYSVDSTSATHQAFAVQDGKFIAVGSNEEILGHYEADSMIDAGGKAVYPGFYDPHSHFLGLGQKLGSADLVGTTSFAAIVAILKDFRAKNPNEPWLTGRGWDQNDWQDTRFPNKDMLDAAFPDTPVYLTRIDGHAALVNSKAIAMAGLDANSKVEGGLVELKNGKPTGILVDNAQDLVGKAIPESSVEQKQKMLQAAEKECLSYGLTTVSDAGLSRADIELIDAMHKDGTLKIRDYAMIGVSSENLDYYLSKGPYQTDRLTVRSFKIYADGALGSRGACLLRPYADAATYGFLLASPEMLDKYISRIADSRFQANTHCIGDSANRVILDIYGKYLKGPNDRRWRIEHAQIVALGDVSKFGKFSIIPSVQPTHTTSDMFWAAERLGAERLKTAYAFKDLLEQNGYIPLGSDFPVEFVNPLFGFHSAVARTDADNKPPGGFQMENALSREQALRGMTIWAAKSNFEENTRGSIEPGKFADFVILEKDIMKVPLTEIRATKVARTVIGGETLFK